MGEVKYLIDNWQPFLQQIVYLVGRGYTEYFLIDYPEQKKDRFLSIDKKLIDKYQCDLTKDQKHYRKRKGFANFTILRWSNKMIMLKTPGEIHSKIKADDKFFGIKETPILIRLTDKVSFEIKLDKEGSLSVYFDKETYKEIRVNCYEAIDLKSMKDVKFHFNNANGFPAWSGLINQRYKMKNEIIKYSKKNALPKYFIEQLDKQLTVKTKRRIYKVFDEK